MKLIIVSAFLFFSSAMAAPQFETISGLFSSASQAVNNGINSFQALGSLLPSSSSDSGEKSNPLGCSVFISGKPEGSIKSRAAGGTYSLCFELEESTCGVKFDFSTLLAPPKPVEVFDGESSFVARQLPEDLCENYLFFPPTSSSFGSKAVCLDRIVEPSIVLIGKPMVVYAHNQPGKEFSIPYSYLTSC